jgi:serine/threonine protein kinase
LLLACLKWLQILRAVDHMHSKGLGHCDIKPSNILIDSLGNFYLGDYGATVPLGEPVHELTDTYVVRASEAEVEQGVVDRIASKAFDYGLLATTLVFKLDKQFVLPCTTAQLSAAAAGVEHQQLRELLTSLLMAE